MICPKCGAQMPDTAVACENCGTLFDEKKGISIGPLSLGELKVSVPTSTQDILNRNLLGMVCSLLLIIGTLLPFYKVEAWGMSQTVNLIQGDGKFMLVLAIIAIVLYVINLDVIALIPGALSLIILIVVCVNTTSALGDYGDYAAMFGVDIGFSIGLFVILIACIGMIAAPFVWSLLAKNLKLTK